MTKKNEKKEEEDQKPKKPSIIKVGFKFGKKNPIAVIAGGAAAVLGSGVIGTIAIGTAAQKVYKNRKKIGEMVSDPSKLKDAVDDGIKSMKGVFGDVVESAKEGMQQADEQDSEADEHEASNDDQPAPEATEKKKKSSTKKPDGP